MEYFGFVFYGFEVGDEILVGDFLLVKILIGKYLIYEVILGGVVDVVGCIDILLVMFVLYKDMVVGLFVWFYCFYFLVGLLIGLVIDCGFGVMKLKGLSFGF